jgi:hypothetical protein
MFCLAIFCLAMAGSDQQSIGMDRQSLALIGNHWPSCQQYRKAAYMITARLHGRLGNQMFQYAAALGLAARHGTDVAIDSRLAERRNEGVLTRVFDLDLASPRKLPPLKQDSALGYGLWRYAGLAPRFRRERGLGYNGDIERWKNGTYLHGYWQSERYFAHVADQVRAAFTFPAFSNSQNADMAAQIGGGPSIALHVRRGDYLTVAAHVLCDQPYYDAALAQITQHIGNNATVYVFSDDPDWAKENLPLPLPKVVVDFNGPETDFEDLRLMSLCDHNIIANSSFSWWSAWLNTNHTKQVAAPAAWFGDAKLQNPDILPDGWLKIVP